MTSRTIRVPALPPSVPAGFAGVLLLAAAAWGQAARFSPPASDRAPFVDSPRSLDFDVARQCVSDVEGLLFDEPGDGALWARATAYKARFDGRGASIVPFFGSDAPRNHPVDFTVASVTLGDAALAGARPATVRRDGEVVRIDRGAFVEEYELAARSLEQRFVFPELPGAGDLRLRLEVSTDLSAKVVGDALRFENELGHVDYGQAFVLDAAGRRSAMERAWVDGAIELRVPASFVATARLPLVVDPVISFSPVADGLRDEIMPDVAYESLRRVWGVAWVSVFSQTDHDVFMRRVSEDGTLLETLPIDVTADTWTTPSIAANCWNGAFMVCAAVVPPSNIADVRGRTVHSWGDVQPVIQITPLDFAYRNGPDVGGVDLFGNQTQFCVVWQRSVSASVVNIECRLVSVGGGLGTIRTLNTTSAVHLFPRVSNSGGEPVGTLKQPWTVVWQTRHTLQDNDVYGCTIAGNGEILDPMFPIATTFWDEKFPVVSTVLDPELAGGTRPCLVAFERDFGSDHDVIGTVLDGSTIVTERNLVGDVEPEFWFRDQRAPSVDTDGEQFMIAFQERSTPNDPNADVFVSTYSLHDGELVPCETRAGFATTFDEEDDVAVHGRGSTGGPRKLHFGVWVHEGGLTGDDVQGGLWEGCPSSPYVSYCEGDGHDAACPCGNAGEDGHGCANSAFPGGAELSASGEANTSNDTLVLQVRSSVPGQHGIFFQGTEGSGGGIGVPFGDGLRCAGGVVSRIQIRLADVTGAAHTTVEISDEISVSPGQLRRYQWWYRDPIGSLCGTGFNLSNGLAIRWVP